MAGAIPIVGRNETGSVAFGRPGEDCLIADNPEKVARVPASLTDPELVERLEAGRPQQAIESPWHGLYLNDLMASAGYSNTPQARKIGLKAGLRLSLDHPPKGWRLAEVPEGVLMVQPPEPADVIISFFAAAKPLPARLPGLAERIFPNGMLWVAWPRRAAGHTSDITDNIVRVQAHPIGLVDVKIAALDEDWSAMRLVWRRQNRSRSSTA